MLIIDILLVAIVGLIIFISAKRGFILTVFDLVSGVIACILARFVAPTVAQLVYDGAVKQIVIDFLTQEFADIESAVASVIADPSALFGFLPENVADFVFNSGLIDINSVSESIFSGITTVEQLEANIVGPVVLTIVNFICYGIISFIFLIALRIVGNLISKLVTVTKLGEKLNSILGAVFGTLKGVLYAFLLSIILVVVSLFSEAVAGYTSVSYICNFAGSLLGL